MSIKQLVFSVGKGGFSRDLGLLVVRAGAGATMLLSHGWGKLLHYGQSGSQ